MLILRLNRVNIELYLKKYLGNAISLIFVNKQN